MSKQHLIDFIEKVQNDPNWKDQADKILLHERFPLGQVDNEERMIWEVLDDLRDIFRDVLDDYPPSRANACHLIDIVKKYLED